MTQCTICGGYHPIGQPCNNLPYFQPPLTIDPPMREPLYRYDPPEWEKPNEPWGVWDKTRNVVEYGPGPLDYAPVTGITFRIGDDTFQIGPNNMVEHIVMPPPPSYLPPGP